MYALCSRCRLAEGETGAVKGRARMARTPPVCMGSAWSRLLARSSRSSCTRKRASCACSRTLNSILTRTTSSRPSMYSRLEICSLANPSASKPSTSWSSSLDCCSRSRSAARISLCVESVSCSIRSSAAVERMYSRITSPGSSALRTPMGGVPGREPGADVAGEAARLFLDEAGRFCSQPPIWRKGVCITSATLSTTALGRELALLARAMPATLAAKSPTPSTRGAGDGGSVSRAGEPGGERAGLGAQARSAPSVACSARWMEASDSDSNASAIASNASASNAAFCANCAISISSQRSCAFCSADSRLARRFDTGASFCAPRAPLGASVVVDVAERARAESVGGATGGPRVDSVLSRTRTTALWPSWWDSLPRELVLPPCCARRVARRAKASAIGSGGICGRAKLPGGVSSADGGGEAGCGEAAREAGVEEKEPGLLA
mmetsp:Transcript_30050/g.73984  ORF Transcript_30050/g.73984 Transcript_30050/m.73984 type:complete len:438 (-) Transcript_30050:46-1359(-)